MIEKYPPLTPERFARMRPVFNRFMPTGRPPEVAEIKAAAVRAYRIVVVRERIAALIAGGARRG